MVIKLEKIVVMRIVVDCGNEDGGSCVGCSYRRRRRGGGGSEGTVAPQNAVSSVAAVYYAALFIGVTAISPAVFSVVAVNAVPRAFSSVVHYTVPDFV